VREVTETSRSPQDREPPVSRRLKPGMPEQRKFRKGHPRKVRRTAAECQKIPTTDGGPGIQENTWKKWGPDGKGGTILLGQGTTPTGCGTNPRRESRTRVPSPRGERDRAEGTRELQELRRVDLEGTQHDLPDGKNQAEEVPPRESSNLPE